MAQYSIKRTIKLADAAYGELKFPIKKKINIKEFHVSHSVLAETSGDIFYVSIQEQTKASAQDYSGNGVLYADAIKTVGDASGTHELHRTHPWHFPEGIKFDGTKTATLYFGLHNGLGAVSFFTVVIFFDVD